MGSLRRYLGPIIIAVIALVIIFGGALVTLYTDWLWFLDLGYQKVFSTILLTQIEIGFLFGLLFFAIIYGNLWYARRIAPPAPPLGMEQQLLQRLGRLARRGIGILLFVGSIVVSAMVGLEAATHWQEWLMYFHSTPFGGKPDPVFGNDIGFYVFRLPFLSYLYHWLFFALAASTVAAVGLHYADEAVEMFGNRLQFAPRVKAHIFTLIALMFFLKAWGYRLGMYNLLFNRGSLFDGAGYTEVNANLPVLWILLAAAILGGIMVLASIRRRGTGFAVQALVGLIVLSVVAGGIYPAIVQRYSVEPNELNDQSPYISRAIEATQRAYGLTEVAARPFAAETTLSAQQIEANRATIENIRLWGKDQLQKQYNQLQTVAQYYHFFDLDVDRYWLTDKNTGETRYRQVWLGARELPQSQLPENAQTWINKYLKYTHGYAYCMSPVNEIDAQGKPLFFVKDIPPKATVDIPIKRMGVYFGELTDDHVFVKTSADEYDYPTGSGGVPTRYKGNGGVRVGGFLRKLMFAVRFGDVNLLLNENIRPDSRVLFRRAIGERIGKLLPFLEFDSDPYLVTVGGKLYWMRDGYTMTNSFPYSKYSGNEGYEFNYIRNSVKVVVDAYTGKVDAYVIEKPLADPIIRTYQKMFPGVFKPISEMPKDLQAHVRYPEDLFRIQTSVYARYHYSTNRPQDFYGNSDLWEIPKRANLTGSVGEEAPPMDPYYVIMKLPNGATEEFILMTPYVHSGARKNMVAWMCAKCDSTDYGRLVLFQLPTKNVNGPQQVATFASQDPNISPQLTLWNKEGSSVGTGDLLVIPVDKSFIYVVPVYLSSTTSGTEIPEIKRVVVALGDTVAMAPTLNDALSSVVGETITVPQQTAAAVTGPGKAGAPGKLGVAVSGGADVAKLVDQANTEYNKAQDALRGGDWAEYGRRMAALEKNLKDLRVKAGTKGK